MHVDDCMHSQPTNIGINLSIHDDQDEHDRVLMLMSGIQAATPTLSLPPIVALRDSEVLQHALCCYLASISKLHRAWPYLRLERWGTGMQPLG